MKRILSICIIALPIIACAGTVVEVSDSSASWKVKNVFAPGGSPALTISSNTIDIYSNGIQVGQFRNTPSEGGQLLLKGPTVSETPNIGCLTNPLSGISVSAGWTHFLFNRAAMWSIGRNGVGVGQITGNAVHRKDSQDPRNSPSIETEGNHDGITWIDNRLPDGVLGHDPMGRFLRFQVGGVNSMSIGRYGVQIGTYTLAQDGVTNSTLTVAGTIESLSGGFKFPDGTIQTTAATGPSSNTFDYIVLTPRLTPPSNPVPGTVYISSATKQGYWWDGSQWLVAW